jgi:DNA-binding HxlR family transcriptional regulator
VTEGRWMDKSATVSKRTYDRFCPLSLALDQVGERWTLHIIMALMSGPKRYSELKKYLAGAGTNILSDRLRRLASDRIVGRSTGQAPGSETTYHLTERGFALAPVIGALATWGLDLLSGTEIGEPRAFDRTWTVDLSTETIDETYQWSIDGVDFELTAHNRQLIRTRGRAARPTVIFKTSNTTFASILTGKVSVAEAIDAGEVRFKGSRQALRRMFSVLGFPFVRVEY